MAREGLQPAGRPLLTAAPHAAAIRGHQREETAMPSKFRPLGDRVLIEPIAAETKSKGGIIIPETAGEKPTRGKVLAVGPGARAEDGRLVKLDVKVGDTVLYGKWSGTEVKLDGKDRVILKESDVLGIEG
jgi:chaperonin GroES